MSVQLVMQTYFGSVYIYGFTSCLISICEENRACLPQSGRHFCPAFIRLEMCWERSVNFTAHRIRDTQKSEQLFSRYLCIVMPHLLHNKVFYSHCVWE